MPKKNTQSYGYGSNYKRNWGKWLIVYLIIAVVIYYLIYLFLKQGNYGSLS